MGNEDETAPVQNCACPGPEKSRDAQFASVTQVQMSQNGDPAIGRSEPYTSVS